MLKHTVGLGLKFANSKKECFQSFPEQFTDEALRTVCVMHVRQTLFWSAEQSLANVTPTRKSNTERKKLYRRIYK